MTSKNSQKQMNWAMGSKVLDDQESLRVKHCASRVAASIQRVQYLFIQGVSLGWRWVNWLECSTL